MLEPETDFKGHTPDEQMFMLEKVFRRYSRCEDAFLSPLDHATAIKNRLYVMFKRYADRPEALKQVSYRMWPVMELVQQLKGASSPSDWGIQRKEQVQEAFFKIRNTIEPKSSPGGLSLERA